MGAPQPRRPAGTPTGGQWAPGAHDEEDIYLSAPGPPSHLGSRPDSAGASDWKPAKIIEVVDTRSYEEGPDDRWHPVPGSGTVNQCDRCGKDHEVHVLVEDQAGRCHVVGSSCAHADGPLARRMANVVSATQKLAVLRRQLSVAEAYWAKRAKAEDELAPQFPGWDEGPAPSLTGSADPRRAMWTTKDGLAQVWLRTYPDEAKPEWERPSDWERRRRQEYEERERCLRSAWLGARVAQEVGRPPNVPSIDKLRSDLSRVEARLEALRDKPGPEHRSIEQADATVVKRSGVDRRRKAVYTEADLAPHIGKTVTVSPAPSKVMCSSSRYYRAPVTGVLHSVWKAPNGEVRGFRLKLQSPVPSGDGAEIEEFGNDGHGTLELVTSS